MNKLILSTVALSALALPALAADLPSRTMAPMLSAPPALTWTGLYVGAIAGYGWSSSALNGASTDGGDGTVIDNNYNLRSTGLVGGLQGGYDWQLGNNLVVGVAGDFTFGGLKKNVCAEDGILSGAGSCASPDASTTYLSTKIDWLSSIRGRAGYAFNNLLVYGTGGVAMAGVKATYTNNNGLGDNDHASQNLVGWALGGGIEYKLLQNVSVGVEYLHMDFGTNTFAFTNPGVSSFSAKVRTTADQVRASVNYRF